MNCSRCKDCRIYGNVIIGTKLGISVMCEGHGDGYILKQYKNFGKSIVDITHDLKSIEKPEFCKK